jgi:hypothetical protein
MSEQRIKIPRASDRAILEAFKEIGALYAVSSAHISALGFSTLGQVNITGEPDGDLAVLLELRSTLIDSVSLHLKGLGIMYYRGGKYPVEQKSPVYDEVVLSHNPQQGDLPIADKLKIVAMLNKKLKAFDPGRVASKGVSEEQNQLTAIHESTLERLEQLNEDLIRQSSEFRRNLEIQHSEKVTKLEEGNSQQRSLLELEFKKKAEDLLEKEKQLEIKLSAIDDRDNTHVRREIRDKMLADVKTRINNFGVSTSTENKRRPVYYGMLGLITILLMLLLYTGYEVKTFAGTNSISAYWLWGRFALYSLGLVGTVLYYIKWENKWAEQHSNSEFQLQQFYIDVNRANWIIESCLEWRKETDSTLPKTLIESISRNLFHKDHNETEKVIHPADQLASALMGSASKAKLRLGDSELEFDKPRKTLNKSFKVKAPTEADT